MALSRDPRDVVTTQVLSRSQMQLVRAAREFADTVKEQISQ